MHHLFFPKSFTKMAFLFFFYQICFLKPTAKMEYFFFSTKYFF
jgi:hypothetical protein